MQVTKTERYVKVDDVKGKLDTKFKILDEPVEVTGTYGKKLECKIKYGDINAKWGINNMSKDTMIDGLGAETSDWIGKTIKVHVQTINNKDAILVNKEQF